MKPPADKSRFLWDEGDVEIEQPPSLEPSPDVEEIPELLRQKLEGEPPPQKGYPELSVGTLS
jgi:hypothetical protein